MKLISTLLSIWILTFATSSPAIAHTDGASAIHEISKVDAPTATLEITKDPTGGFNVRVLTAGFTWRPEMASMRHVNGEGHAHVYLDGRKIMRIYNQWFHLNTFQFADKSGEQLVSIELVGNDHAPYTIEGLPVGAEQLIDVQGDEIRPQDPTSWKPLSIAALLVSSLLFSLIALRILTRKRSQA